jgi:hypothetical protein
MKPWHFSEEGSVPCENNPEAWFPRRPNNMTQEEKLAVKICGSCAFQKPCLDFGLRNQVDGTWGGHTSKERTRMSLRMGIKVNPMIPSSFVPMR